MFHSRRIWLTASLLLLLVGSAAYWHHARQRLADFTVHDRGLLFAAGALDPATISELIEMHQFRTVILLHDADATDDARWNDERRAVEGAGADFVLEPFGKTAAADDPSVARQIAILQDPDNYPILVHGARGLDRTARFLLTYDLLFRGVSIEEAIALQPKFPSADNADKRRAELASFARDLEQRHAELYPTASAENLKILR